MYTTIFEQDNNREKPEELKSIKVVYDSIPELVEIAQEVYDKWDELDIDTYAGGGICHIIAEEIGSYLTSLGVDTYISSSNFEQHVYCIVRVQEGVYSVDIPPSYYEIGSGYSWSKIPDVTFDESFIHIDMLSPDPEDIIFYVYE